jgi:outer membrane usher protein
MAMLLVGSLMSGSVSAQSDSPSGETALADFAVNGESRGSVQFTLGDDGSPLLKAGMIRDALAGIARPEVIAAVASGDGFVSTEDLRLVGVRVSFDAAALVLGLDVEPRAMIPVDLSHQNEKSRHSGGTALEPENFAAQLGLSLTLDPSYTSSAYDSQFSPRAELGLAPAFNVMGVVAEGSAEISYYDNLTTRLDQARFLKDFPNQGARLEAGIVDTRPVSFQSSNELVGLAFFRESTLPGSKKSGRPLLEEFVIERKADVSIEINGVVARRLQLSPGSYRLSDLPLSSGLNEVTVKIVEEGEEPRSIRLGVPFDSAILETGQLDYSITLGADRETDSRPLGAANLALGLGSDLQLGADAEAGFGSVLSGVSGLWASPVGNLGASIGASAPCGDKAIDPSYGARLSWRLSIPRLAYAPRVGFAVEYRNTGFAPPREDATVTVPLQPTWTISGQVSEALPGRMGSTFFFADSDIEAGKFETLAFSTGVFLPLSKVVSVSVSCGTDWSAGNGFSPSASVAVSVTPGNRRTLQYHYDAVKNADIVDASAVVDSAGTTTVGAHGEGIVNGHVDVVEFSAKTATGAFDLSAAAEYNRTGDNGSRTVGGIFSASTNLAYAGGHFVAARNLCNAFAILVPDKSVGKDTVELSSSNGPSTVSEGGAPALVAGIVPYEPYYAAVEMPESAPDRRADPPAITFYPSYRSGTVIRARSASSVAVHGRLVDQGGKPLTNLSGDRIGADGAAIAFSGTFTDEAGFFECYGLDEGDQLIRWSDGSTSRFTVVPDSSGGSTILELGDVTATGRQGDGTHE